MFVQKRVFSESRSFLNVQPKKQTGNRSANIFNLQIANQYYAEYRYKSRGGIAEQSTKNSCRIASLI